MLAFVFQVGINDKKFNLNSVTCSHSSPNTQKLVTISVTNGSFLSPPKWVKDYRFMPKTATQARTTTTTFCGVLVMENIFTFTTRHRLELSPFVSSLRFRQWSRRCYLSEIYFIILFIKILSDKELS